MRCCVLALLAAAMVCCGRAQQAAPEVEVQSGILRGKWLESELLKRPVKAFEGIPFAEPPVGALRFQPPVAAAPWSGVKVADQLSSKCTQRDSLLHKTYLEGGEDCLYLNVYAPETASTSKPLPVMVWVHGGGFTAWSGGMFGPDLLMDRDVVYVNFNYRLGPLGFLSTADEVIPGNNGMKDQVLALAWVRDNIKSFGGDPNSITIFGQSAGGASVHWLTLSPLTKGLFHRAISMSGSAFAPWAYQNHTLARHNSRKLASVLNCPEQPSEQLRDCLLNKTAEEIIGTDVAFNQWNGHPLVNFMPTAERSGPGAFIDRPPRQLAPREVPVMFGTVSQDGCLVTGFLRPNETALRELDHRFDDLVPVMMYYNYLPEGIKSRETHEARHLYLGKKPVAPETIYQLTDLYTDGFLQHWTQQSVTYQKKHSRAPVYFYELSHVTKDRTFAIPFGDYKINETLGMCHCDDTSFLFPFKMLFADNWTPSDRAYSKHLLDLFTTFAYTGKPTLNNAWTPVRSAEEPEYAFIREAGQVSMRRTPPPRSPKQSLWNGVQQARAVSGQY